MESLREGGAEQGTKTNRKKNKRCKTIDDKNKNKERQGLEITVKSKWTYWKGCDLLEQKYNEAIKEVYERLHFKAAETIKKVVN